MSYWFEDPALKGLLPLATATAIKGLTTFFNVPFIIMGSNVLPEGLVIGPSTVDFLMVKCEKKRAFIITDEFAKQFASRVAKTIEPWGFATETWSKVLPEAPLDNVMEAGAAMTRFEPDLIIAVGGGSVMDSAKAAWIVYERPDLTDLNSMVSPLAMLGMRKKAILMAVPTTSGTGSECTAAAVIHDTKAHRKIPLANAELLPDIALLVPEFTMSMPPKLTVGTGLDVLAHAMDAVIVPTANELTDAISITAIKMVFKYLPRAYRNGQDREARHRMLMASSLAGIGFGNAGAAALTHGFGHAVGGFFNIHHGLMVGMFIPYTFQFYRDISDKYLEICQALGIKGKTNEDKLAGLVKRVRDLFKELDVPLSLKELGINADEFKKNIDTLALYALEDIDTVFSPRPITIEQCKKLLRYAYEGKDVDF
jgi:alcohol dehydrogenase class IV